MAEPKKKMTSTRSGNRRSQINVKPLSLTNCSKCKTPIMPHSVCYICGTYGGKVVIDVGKKERKRKEKAAAEAEKEKEHEHDKDKDEKKKKE